MQTFLQQLFAHTIIRMPTKMGKDVAPNSRNPPVTISLHAQVQYALQQVTILMANNMLHPS